ncbi:MAG: carbohydrate kinase family protein [Thermoproteota archaeon]|jgi:ribokinase|nr:carbohydrate kinase family protein [Thermoproteota archaeon]
MNGITVMPDFFVDRIVRLQSKEDFFNSLSEKSRSGGGSIRGIPTLDVKGGNAVNIAYSLAKLGMKTSLFTIADDIGLSILRHVFSRFEGNKINLRITKGKHGHTTAFEFSIDKSLSSRVNVMVSDVGDNANFGPDRITSEEDLLILKNSDGVMVVNWGSNLKGSQLTEYVFKNSPKALHFIDPADIENRKSDFLVTLKQISQFTDVLSINENECNSLLSAIGFAPLIPQNESYTIDNIKNAATMLAKEIGISIDLHTRNGAAWSNGNEIVFVHPIKVEPKTLTGAGDSWDAADIVGYLAGLEPKERLLFSNAYASLYVRNPFGEPATISEVIDMLERIGM